MPFGTLWLPVLVSAAAVWIASAVAHMVLPHHRADYKRLPNEDAIGDAMRKASLARGVYMTPHCDSPKQLSDPAVIEKFKKGPVALITVMRSGPPSMGRELVLWLGFCLLVSFVTSYLARHTLGYGASGLEVLRVTGTVAFACYGLSHVSDSIWKGLPWGHTLRHVADAVAYAVLTGLTFRFMWPAA
jgi:hypothetical protein